MDILLRIPDQLGHQLKALRKQRGLSQAELGQRIGVGQARIADIEARPALVSVEQMMRIFSVLGAEFVLRAGPQGPDAAAGAATPAPAGAGVAEAAGSYSAKPRTAKLPAPKSPASKSRQPKAAQSRVDQAPSPVPGVLDRSARKGSW